MPQLSKTFQQFVFRISMECVITDIVSTSHVQFLNDTCTSALERADQQKKYRAGMQTYTHANIDTHVN